MKQQRPERLICSKFYFQITIKSIEVHFRVIYEIMHGVNRKSPEERNIPGAPNKGPEGTQKQTPELPPLMPGSLSLLVSCHFSTR